MATYPANPKQLIAHPQEQKIIAWVQKQRNNNISFRIIQDSLAAHQWFNRKGRAHTLRAIARMVSIDLTHPSGRGLRNEK